MKKFAGVILSVGFTVLLAGGASMTAGAEVVSVKEATGGPDCIYVAGNPDWYPVEYYNEETGQYEGILPETLRRVGEKTGLSFSYIRAGARDERERLAKNGQVEIVSGCDRSEEEDYGRGFSPGQTILSFEADGEQKEVCLFYTWIAGEELKRTVEEALGSITEGELLEIAVAYTGENAGTRLPRLLFWAVGAVILILGIRVFVLSRRLKEASEKADRERLFDPVTGLGNLEYFVKNFETYLSDQSRAAYCMIFIGFQADEAESLFGAEGAERLLCHAADELLKSTGDTDIVARVGEDRFAVVHLCGGEEEGKRWAEEMIQGLNRYEQSGGTETHAEFAAGVYMLGQSDRDAKTCLYNARQGYEDAVRRGKNVSVSHARMLKEADQRAELQLRLREAIRERQFKPVFQFIVSAKDGGLWGAEVLSRWDHPERGRLYPAAYIELMEDERMVPELDFFIFEEACRKLEEWQKRGLSLSLSCNFTRITIAEPAFTERIREIAGKYAIERSGLMLEITEDAMETTRELAFQNILECRNMGFRIALDDMGSAHTSFSDLRDYPLDLVKIDRSILNAAVNDSGRALLKGMIGLGHSLNMEVLCEGIETEGQAGLIRELGCDYMQGYHFYRAVPGEEADRIAGLPEPGSKGSPMS